MSLLTFASSTETASLLQSIASVAAALVWPMLGLGVIAVLAFIFKPLFLGMWRVVLLLVKPRKSLERRIAKNKEIGTDALMHHRQYY